LRVPSETGLKPRSFATWQYSSNSKEIQFHLNLAEVYSLAGLHEMSLYKLDYALGLFNDDPRLKRARSKIEKRRTPVLPFFGREHFLNRKLGKLRHRILKDAE
jgi:hypothetical protein